MKRITILGALVVAACLMNGCRFGMTAPKYRPAQGANGVTMRVVTAQGGNVAGELIEVRDAGIVVLSDQKLRLLPFAAIVSSSVDQTSSHYSISNRTAPKPDVQAHLRLLSRFPQGLTPELMQQLLVAHGQTELDRTNP